MSAQISMEGALTELQKLLPSLDSFDFAAIHRCLVQRNIRLEWTPLYDSWENMDDVELLHLLIPDMSADGTLLMIPDSCFCGFRGRVDPFLLAASEVEEFVRTFFSHFGEAFFNGDTICVWRERRRLYLFDHDGNYAAAQL